MKLDRAHVLTGVNAVLSLAMSLAFFAWYALLDSSLALAQAADSLLDLLTAGILAWAVRVAAKPGDARHPFGHHSAEPLSAMWVAAMAALLAYRVAADAIEALWTGSAPPFSAALVAGFLVKALARGGLMIAIDRQPRSSRGQALGALRVDARNDVLLSLGSVAAALAARWHPLADPSVALPMAGWIGWSGYELARENTRLLMGEAPSPERLAQLRSLVEGLQGIQGVHDVRAQTVGNEQLEVHLHIDVDPTLRVGQAHDLGERAREAVEAQPDVERCMVHIDAGRAKR